MPTIKHKKVLSIYSMKVTTNQGDDIEYKIKAENEDHAKLIFDNVVKLMLRYSTQKIPRFNK